MECRGSTQLSFSNAIQKLESSSASEIQGGFQPPHFENADCFDAK